MNETIKRQLDHRSIRAYKDMPVEKEKVEILLEVARQTSTSTGMQHWSIIRVTDPEVRAQIREVANQPYIETVPELWVFIADCYRNYRIALEQGVDEPTARDMDRFFQGYTDAAIAAQNTMNAFESLGLGGVFFGSILNDAQKITEILKLPELTFPVVGLGFGYPNQEPALKPRMPLEFRVFENEYKRFDEYLPLLKDYDEVMHTYYDLRNTKKPLDRFTAQVAGNLKNPVAKRDQQGKLIVKQGFDLKLDK